MSRFSIKKEPLGELVWLATRLPRAPAESQTDSQGPYELYWGQASEKLGGLRQLTLPEGTIPWFLRFVQKRHKIRDIQKEKLLEHSRSSIISIARNFFIGDAADREVFISGVCFPGFYCFIF